jgi:hypothetical protein
MLGMLEIVFGGDRVAGALGIAGELQIFLGDVVRGAADLHLRPVRFVNPGQRIVMVSATAATAMVALVVPISSPHALVLSVSHGSPVADSCLRRLFPRRFVHPTSSRTFQPETRAGLCEIKPARDTATLKFIALFATVLGPRSHRGGAFLSLCESLSLMRRKVRCALDRFADPNLAILFAV